MLMATYFVHSLGESNIHGLKFELVIAYYMY